MNALIERVARALTVHLYGLHAEDDWERQESLAREAIEAMREPTHEMLCAVNDYAQGPGIGPDGWSAAIDEALK